MSSGRSGCNVFVANLGPNVTDKDLLRTFQAFGEVLSAKVMRDIHQGTTRGFGFVLFTDPQSAAAAIQGHGTTWNVQLAAHDAFNVVEKSKKIYARNIPPQMAQDEVMQFFSRFGRVANLTIKSDSERAPRFRRSDVGDSPIQQCNVCFVEFETEEDARQCVESTQNVRLAQGCGPLLTKFAEPPEVRDARKQRRLLANETYSPPRRSETSVLLAPPVLPQQSVMMSGLMSQSPQPPGMLSSSPVPMLPGSPMSYGPPIPMQYYSPTSPNSPLGPPGAYFVDPRWSGMPSQGTSPPGPSHPPSMIGLSSSVPLLSFPVGPGAPPPAAPPPPTAAYALSSRPPSSLSPHTQGGVYYIVPSVYTTHQSQQ